MHRKIVYIKFNYYIIRYMNGKYLQHNLALLLIYLLYFMCLKVCFITVLKNLFSNFRKARFLLSLETSTRRQI